MSAIRYWVIRQGTERGKGWYWSACGYWVADKVRAMLTSDPLNVSATIPTPHRLVRVTRKSKAEPVPCMECCLDQEALAKARQAALEEAERVCRERATSQYGAMAIHLADAIGALKEKK